MKGTSLSSFSFCIPLKPRRASQDWRVVERNLTRTIESILHSAKSAQQAGIDCEVSIDIACHDEPTLPYGRNDGVTIESVGFEEPGDPSLGEADKGRKRRFLGARLRNLVGPDGVFTMFLDADDLVHRQLIETAIIGGRESYFLPNGYIFDARRGVLQLRMGDFYSVCGSSFICKFRQQELPISWRDETASFSLFTLTERQFWHDRFPIIAEDLGKKPLAMTLPGVMYLVNHEDSLFTASRAGARRRTRLRDLRRIVTPIESRRLLRSDFGTPALAAQSTGYLGIGRAVLHSAIALARTLIKNRLALGSATRTRNRTSDDSRRQGYVRKTGP